MRGAERGEGGLWVVKLMKQKKGGGNTLSFTSPEKDFFYISDVMTWEKKKKTLYMTTHVTSDAPSFILHLHLPLVFSSLA